MGEEKIVKCVHCTKDKYESQLTHSEHHGGLVCNNCNADKDKGGNARDRAQRVVLASPQKRIDELETAIRVIGEWAEFDLKNKPTIPRALVPAHVAKLCQKALVRSTDNKPARDTW